MSFVIKRSDGFYARVPHQRPKGAVILNGSPKWDNHTRSANRFSTRQAAEEVAGLLQNPPPGVTIEVVEI